MDIYKLAISLEEELEQYYIKQAEENKDHRGLVSVFLLLAREERKHADILVKHKSKISGLELSDSSILTEVKEIFKDMASMTSEIKSIPDQLDVYKYAQEKEVESIEAYEKLMNEATGEEEKEIFSYLKNEEVKHFSILGELIDFISKPEEWVEDAEFGLRKEY